MARTIWQLPVPPSKPDDVLKWARDLSKAIGDHLRWLTSPSVLNHGALAGLADDDHPQYTEYAKDETITGSWTFSTNTTFTGGATFLTAGTLSVSAPVILDMHASEIRFSDSAVGIVLHSNVGVGPTYDTKQTISTTAGALNITFNGGGYGGNGTVSVVGSDVTMDKTLTVADNITISTTGKKLTGAGTLNIYGDSAASGTLALESTSHATKGTVNVGLASTVAVGTSGIVTVGGQVQFTRFAETAGATVTISLSNKAVVRTWTAGQAESVAISGTQTAWQILILMIASDGTARLVKFDGGGFSASVGNITTNGTSGKISLVAFISDGTSFYEMYRTNPA